jgi:hypothetical protein
MVERHVRVGNRVVRAGTDDDAGRLCRTDKQPGGIAGATYRRYTTDGDAPGPLRLAPRRPGEPGVLLQDEAGGHLYDLDAVEAWHKARPGKGGRAAARITADTVRRTDLRELVMVAARDGRLVVEAGPYRGRPGPTLIDGRRQSARVAQSCAEMQRVGGLSSTPAGGGPLRVTAVGRRIFARWGVTDPETPHPAVDST